MSTGNRVSELILQVFGAGAAFGCQKAADYALVIAESPRIQSNVRELFTDYAKATDDRKYSIPNLIKHLENGEIQLDIPEEDLRRFVIELDSIVNEAAADRSAESNPPTGKK